MNYKGRRNRAKLSLYTMARELGMPKEKYIEVEKRKRELPRELLDKFVAITEPQKAREINFNRKQKLRTINEWIKTEAENKMKEMGYNQCTLAKASGIAQPNISFALAGKQTSDDTKEEMYDFLNNPLNKIVATEKKTQRGVRPKPKTEEQIEIEKWIEKNAKKKMKALKTTVKELADKIGGATYSEVRGIIDSTTKGNLALKIKIYEYLNRDEEEIFEEEKTKIVEAEPIEEIIKTPIEEPIETPTETIHEEPTTIEEKTTIELLIQENEKLKRQVMLYEKLIERL